MSMSQTTSLSVIHAIAQLPAWANLACQMSKMLTSFSDAPRHCCYQTFSKSTMHIPFIRLPKPTISLCILMTHLYSVNWRVCQFSHISPTETNLGAIFGTCRSGYILTGAATCISELQILLRSSLSKFRYLPFKSRPCSISCSCTVLNSPLPCTSLHLSPCKGFPNRNFPCAARFGERRELWSSPCRFHQLHVHDYLCQVWPHHSSCLHLRFPLVQLPQ